MPANLPLAAHNAAFDMSVLRAALEWYELPVPPFKYFCTLKLARAAWPELKSHALTSLWNIGNNGIGNGAGINLYCKLCMKSCGLPPERALYF
jgi:DNA polymerase III epsilon subunit-like protein